MRFLVTFNPPTTRSDFYHCLADLREREKKPQENKQASWIRAQLTEGKLFPRFLSRRILSSPTFDSWCRKTVQKWTLIDWSWQTRTIEYEYDTAPVGIEAIASITDLSMKINKMADFRKMILEAHRKMWRDSAKGYGYPDTAISVEPV